MFVSRLLDIRAAFVSGDAETVRGAACDVLVAVHADWGCPALQRLVYLVMCHKSDDSSCDAGMLRCLRLCVARIRRIVTALRGIVVPSEAEQSNPDAVLVHRALVFVVDWLCDSVLAMEPLAAAVHDTDLICGVAMLREVVPEPEYLRGVVALTQALRPRFRKEE